MDKQVTTGCNISFGDAGEQIAADYLLAAGYKLLERKYRAKTGEIDIVAKDGDMFVFIEVKTRSSNVFGTPAQAVTWQKQKKIISTALCYLKHRGAGNPPLRFDVFEVMLQKGGGTARCNHIVNAFGQ
jgi:putative endonuclease